MHTRASSKLKLDVHREISLMFLVLYYQTGEADHGRLAGVPGTNYRNSLRP